MEIKVHHKFARITPRKARLVADLIRGQTATSAAHQLAFARKKASAIISKLLKSGLAAAKEKNRLTENLYVKNIFVNDGPKLKRRRLNSRGRSSTILKRASHITLSLSEKNPVEKKSIAAKINKTNLPSTKRSKTNGAKN